MITLVCASANPDKVAEIESLLAGAVDLRPRPADVPDVVEDADTLEGNARLKAVAIATATGQAAVADDTGLEVAALGGRPGVHTARYAGERATYADNRAHLLAELAGADDRRARFRTVAAVVWPDGRELLVDGVCSGTIAGERAGDRWVRLRRRVRPGRRRRPNLRRDRRDGQAPALVARPRVQGVADGPRADRSAGARVTSNPR